MFARNESQSGFTLAELAIALVILSVLSVFVMDQLGPMFQYQARVSTRSKTDDLAQAFRLAYRTEVVAIENEASAHLRLSTGLIEPMGADVHGRCTANAAALAPLNRYLQNATGIAFRDGNGAPFCIFMTPGLTRDVGGVAHRYRVIAVVSTGWNNRIDADAGCAGTSLSNTGELTLCGDDEGVRIDTLPLMMDLVAESQKRLDRIARAYERHFQSRFEADPARDLSVDYFASGTPADRWDGGNPIGTTGCAGAAPLVSTTAAISPHAALGLSTADVTDAFGQIIGFDNCSSAVRSPNNVNTNLQVPPYTAVIRSTLPGGGVLEAAAMSSL